MDPDELTDSIPLLPPAGDAWAISHEAIQRVVELGRTVARGEHTALATSHEVQAARRSRARTGGAVAVIPLTGILTPRGSFLSYLFGGGWGGLVDFREAFGEAVASPDIGAIVIDVDSPGGVSSLVQETGDEIFAARGSKPIIAIANTLAASAAYWIATQADELVVTPSGQVGSVGTYILHESWAGWNEQAGIDPTYIVAAASPYKVEGNADEPLSETARAMFQERVDEVQNGFTAAVARGRGVSAEKVNEDFGQGRCFSADRALAAGMVDRVATIEQVISDLLSSNGGSGARSEVAPAPAQTAVTEPEPETEETTPAVPVLEPAARSRVADVLLG